MQKSTSLSLGPTSDLVVAGPWKKGLIPADEPILPKSRLALTFKTIFELRRRSREAVEIAAFADPIERLEQIHSFRLAAEAEGLRLAVTYDFGWETYMRALWRDAGPFLDLLCCHCEGYKLARATSFDEWRTWIRDHQRASDYFYSATSLTVGDLAALAQGECVQRDTIDSVAGDRLVAGLASQSAAELARGNRLRFPAQAVRQAVSVVAVMYRLTRFWTADVRGSSIAEDAITLIRATRGLIEDSFVAPGSLPPPIEAQYRTELSWYRQPLDDERPALRRSEPAAGNVQRGILTSHDEPDAPITHGAALYLAIVDPRPDRHDARASLAGLSLTAEGTPAKDKVFRNLAFTFSGLERIGKPAAVLATSPEAFHQGAAARAGRVGDTRAFHPSRWQPLRRNWAPDPDWTVDHRQIDVVVQLRTSAEGAPIDIADSAHPLHDEIALFAAPGRYPGLALLAVEGLAHADARDPERDHLGLRDGLSQPKLTGTPTTPWSDVVEPGALLVGRGDVQVDDFWRDGSFLAIRRLTIDRPRFEAMTMMDARPELSDPALLIGKLLGRMPDGTPLAPDYGNNNFVYDGDEKGELCPLHSHVRRANPRRPDTPRIMRRGMSFGPRGGTPGRAERGSLFMAYCADLAEQYERVLGWVNGGNSTRTGSYLGDPLTGVPDAGGPRTFRFLHGGTPRRLTLPAAGQEVIGLSWSLYLFAPSLAAIRALEEEEEQDASDVEAAQVARGHEIICLLKSADAETWRALLNEPSARDSGDPQAVWAAIRAHRGILETSAGYLVARYGLVLEVLRDDGHRFSNGGAGARMIESIGKFHLGLDPYTQDYKDLSGPANAALRSIHQPDAFALAREKTIGIVATILERSKATAAAPVTIDLLKDLIEPVMAVLGGKWFDIPDDIHVVQGSQTWAPVEPRKPCYPGDFWSPSRAAFNPFSSAETDRLARCQGKAAVAAATKAIETRGRDRLHGAVSKQMAAAKEAYPSEEDLARVLVGAMIGGVPTVAGNAIRLLVIGLESGELERAQPAWLALAPSNRTYPYADRYYGGSIADVLQRMPVPEVLWRVVAADDVELGGLKLPKDSMLIFSLESAGLDRLQGRQPDSWIAFGMAPTGEPQPPHGCPGRDMAIGTILGLVAGLLEAVRFRPAGRALAELWPLT